MPSILVVKGHEPEGTICRETYGTLKRRWDDSKSYIEVTLVPANNKKFCLNKEMIGSIEPAEPDQIKKEPKKGKKKKNVR